MSEFFTKPINNAHCKDKFAVGPNDGNYFVICDGQDEAHKLSLDLLMEKIKTPEQAPSLYLLCFEICGSKYYKLLAEQAQADDSEDINSCCMSGCTGCPTYAKAMNK